jgi:hypothetical protein
MLPSEIPAVIRGRVSCVQLCIPLSELCKPLTPSLRPRLLTSPHSLERPLDPHPRPSEPPIAPKQDVGADRSAQAGALRL